MIARVARPAVHQRGWIRRQSGGHHVDAFEPSFALRSAAAHGRHGRRRAGFARGARRQEFRRHRPKCGETSGDADTLSFKDGRFRSSACDPYGYGDGAYTATQSGEAIAFEAETESPQYGKLLWKGTVRGPRLDGTMTMVRDGQSAGEKWVLAGEKR